MKINKINARFTCIDLINSGKLNSKQILRVNLYESFTDLFFSR